MFALGIRYLNGWAMATHPADRHRAEWPPHPDRLFMALAAAHFETGEDGTERAALEWLERQGAPELHVSDCHRRDVLTAYVPVNDNANPCDGKGKPYQPMRDLGVGRNRQPRSFPVAVPHDPVCFLRWPEAAPSSNYLTALEKLCAKVTSVGHSASLVQVWVEPQPPQPTLVPLQGLGGKYRLRVPSQGRLSDLERRYNKVAVNEYAALRRECMSASSKRRKEIAKIIEDRFANREPTTLRPDPGLWWAYGNPTPASATPSPISSVFDASLLVLRRVSGPRLGLESTLQVSAALRDTVMTLCPQPLPEWVSGHLADGSPSRRAHLAYFPLPHVNHPHADGHLMGMAIAIPREVSCDDQHRVLNALLFDRSRNGIPRTIELRMGRIGVWTVVLHEEDITATALMPETWTAHPTGVRHWATVTPITFDRHPKQEGDLERMIATACERIGLPCPVNVIPVPVSMFIGAPHGRQFPCLQRKTGGSMHHTHAILTFDEAIVGPVLLGAGRYRGYGLCRPISERES